MPWPPSRRSSATPGSWQKPPKHCANNTENNQERLSQRIYVLRTGESLLCTQAVHDELERQGAIKLLGVPSAIWLGVPLIIEGKTIGAMVVQHCSDPKAYGKREQHMLEFVSSQVTIAISRKQAEEEIRKRADELAALNLLGRQIGRSLSLEDVFSDAIEGTFKAVQPDFAYLFLREGERLFLHGIVPVEGRDIFADVPEHRVGECMCGLAIQEGKPLYSQDIFADPRCTWEECKKAGLHSFAALPLSSGEESIGVIGLASRQKRDFEKQARFLETLASQVSIGIRNAMLYEKVQQELAERKQTEEHLRLRTQESETLRQAAVTLTSSLELNQVLDGLLDQLAKVIPYDGAAVFLKENDHLRIVAAKGFSQMDSALNQLFPADSGLFREIGNNHVPVILADAQADSRFQRWGSTDYVRGWIGVPLITHDQVVGYLSLGSRTVDAYDQLNANLAWAFATQAAVAIENARLYESEQRRRQEAEALRQVAQVISASLDVNEVFRLMLNQLKLILTFDTASVLLLGESGQSDLVTGVGYANEKITFQEANNLLKDSPILKRMAQDLKPLTITDVRKSPEWIWVSGAEHVRSFLAVPIVAHQRMIGALMADSVTPGFFSEDEMRVAQSLAQHMSIAIENARLYQEAVKAAERRVILHRASQEIAQASQTPDRVYEAVHRAATQLMPAEAFVISVLETSSDQIHLVYLYDKDGRSPALFTPKDSGLSGDVISTGQAIIVDDLDEKPLPDAIHFGSSQEVRSILAVPMWLGKKVIGMLSAQSYNPHTYTEEDQSLLEMLAANAAVAIENARLYNEAHKRLNELEVVNRISTALREAETTPEMLPILLDEVLGALQSDAGAIWLYDPPKQALVEAIGRGWFEEINELSIASGEGIVGLVFQKGQVFVSREFTSDPQTSKILHSLIPPGWGGACVPIRASQEIIGVMFFAVQLPRQVLPEEIHLLTTISEIAGNAIRRSDLHAQTQRQVQRLASLRAIDMAINTILDLRVTLGILIDHILYQLKVDAVDVLLFNSQTQTLHYAASSGFRKSDVNSWQVHISDDITGKVVRTRSTLFIQNLRESTQNRRFSTMASEQFVSYCCVPLIAKGQVKGVLEILNRSILDPDADWKNFLETLAGQAAIAIDNALLIEELQKSNIGLALAYDATIEGWSKALDLRDRETEGHTQRVTFKIIELAQVLGISASEQVHIRWGALLHDIGKMGVPDNILFKEGPLTDEEWDVMHLHPVFAYEMLHPITYLRPAVDIPYCHHERWDGSGYPRKLRGEEIPLAARLFAVVDMWDALTSDRPYRKAWTQKATFDYIKKTAGSCSIPALWMLFSPLCQKNRPGVINEKTSRLMVACS
jgi:GAF domain-containing protein